ncbi:acyltransferase [Halobacteriovorax sp.]|uniref:acyltransferase n=1 Tax=Halobacteriovorax sp. TaxID=2020862 RepID=UPI003AF313E3
MISKTAIIYPNVKIGKNVTIEDYCIVGSPPRGYNEGELETIIGDNAIIRSHTVIYAGNIIGSNFQTGNKANIRELNLIGDNVSIGTLSIIEHNVKIMNNCRIHSQVFIPEYSILEDGAWVGPNVVFTNAKYPKQPDTKDNLIGPTLKKNSIIGANTTLLPGIEIGENAMVGAGSVVTKNVKSNYIVAGNPAKFIRER